MADHEPAAQAVQFTAPEIDHTPVAPLLLRLPLAPAKPAAQPKT